MAERIELRRAKGGVYTLTIRRPDVRNALDLEMFQQIGDACVEVDADRDARVLVLTGEPPAFSAGADLAMLRQVLEMDREATLDALERIDVTYLALARVRVPTLAAVNGDAYGGAAALVLAADFRVMSAGARLGLIFTRIGLSGADVGSTWWLSRLVGPARAFEILALGRVFTAAEALDAGLVIEVAPSEEFPAAVASFTDRLARLAPLAVQSTKRAFQGIEGRSLAEQLALEAQLQADVLGSADFREGLTAYQENRPPEFKGS